MLALCLVLFSSGSEQLLGLSTLCCEGRGVARGQGRMLWVKCL
jgi:hypothetical protein